MDYTFFEDLAGQLPPVTPNSIVSRTIYDDERVKVVLFGFAVGQELSEHTASTPAILHILSGAARLTLAEDALEAVAGAWVHMPARMPHSLLAKTPVTMLLLLLRGE